MGRREDLLRQEADGWEELIHLVDGLTAEQLERPGYTAEGWSIRELLWHLARWCDEAADVIGRIADGTWDGVDPAAEPGWVERQNLAWFEESRGMPLEAVRVRFQDARARMLARFGELSELTPEADEWFDESGPRHYAEHLPDLRAWVERLRTG